MASSSHRARFGFLRVAATLTSVLALGSPCALAAQAAGQVPAGQLEALAEQATRAAVLIDVRTASDSRQGSGFIVDPAGVILTNYHVIRDARSARVKLASGDVYEQVLVLAEDRRRDIAVLRISGFDLPTLRLGNSDSLRIGAPVVLIGSPLGLENTVSTGILSGRRQEPEGFQLLQITAPASQGSSGGAVLANDGRVIGIAASQLLAGQNLNFAVPVNYARGLLQNLEGEPIAVLQGISTAQEDNQVRPMASETAVNSGLRFELSDFRGYVAESETTLGEDLQRRTRVTYRLIETVGGGAPRLERYLESETTRRTEPFGTRQTIRRARVRSLVTADGLRPLSSRGEISWWEQDGWRSAKHDIRFEEDRVVGIVTDTTGRSVELDRVVPRGMILREVRDLAFATLAVDSLVGRSVEFSAFDAWSGEVVEDRYDVLRQESVEALGKNQDVLRVNVASGLENETVYFLRQRPRIALRRVSQDGSQMEVVTSLQVDGSRR
ncbi:MAG TPA: trypsin-like peptidase domain-containing protein [Longimicrobiales bacterium]|nr:trypsin-like peptidase domain-containing protein [Longimicrobiales bacterium]